MSPRSDERLRRWRLVLGADEADGIGEALSTEDRAIDEALGSLYDPKARGGLKSSSPYVARWLGDIRRYFPASSVKVMQRDALERLDLERLLMEPELLEAVEPDVGLVATLLSLKSVIPDRTRETARSVVRQLCKQLEERLRVPTIQAVEGGIDRASRTRRPRPRDVDWNATILRNLRHYQPDRRALIVERLVGHGRRRSGLKDVVLCVDQSGSMAASVVYAGIFASVLANVRAVSTRLVVFDTSVVDLSDALSDPVDVLFGTQLGGGTDIARALTYCEQLITRPADTVLVLVSDLFEGGDAPRMLRRAKALVDAGARVICLLALSDEGAPTHHEGHAAYFAAIGIPTFACTPDQFPALMGRALSGADLQAWAASEGIVATRPGRLSGS